LHPRKFSNPLTGELVLAHPQPLLVPTRSVTGDQSQVMVAGHSVMEACGKKETAMMVANDCHSPSTMKHHFR
jgi:hypothetical protein